MPKQITITVSDLQYDGIVAAQEFNNPEISPEAYVEKVMIGAAESYMKQFGVERPTIESLSFQLGAANDKVAQLTSDKANLSQQLETSEAARASLQDTVDAAKEVVQPIV